MSRGAGQQAQEIVRRMSGRGQQRVAVAAEVVKVHSTSGEEQRRARQRRELRDKAVRGARAIAANLHALKTESALTPAEEIAGWKRIVDRVKEFVGDPDGREPHAIYGELRSVIQNGPTPHGQE